MSTKKGNRVVLFSTKHGRVTLVKRSLGMYKTDTKVWDAELNAYVRITDYYRGQLACDWMGLRKGRVVWLNAWHFKIQEYE